MPAFDVAGLVGVEDTVGIVRPAVRGYFTRFHCLGLGGRCLFGLVLAAPEVCEQLPGKEYRDCLSRRVGSTRGV